MTHAIAQRILVASIAALLAGCAATPLRPPPGVSLAELADEAFEVAGRLSARQRDQGAAANFRWTHRTDSDQLSFATPLGSTLAQLDGTKQQVRLELPDGRVAEASSWEALTLRALGAPIPVRGLAWWMRGVPHPETPHAIELDSAGRASVLRQDGWEIVYGYSAAFARPARLRLTYPDTELRLVIDAWEEVR